MYKYVHDQYNGTMSRLIIFGKANDDFF